ncbi:sugar kinase [Haloferax elongans ATCC BAA-1513]|uniref:Sugar kinase n=1 Tax=Haloferax elongans ATCC BAA-1513 TaxID=1230453 RepID=M0HVV9_HALEO|nr:sugar kinase [Haloferax elongans]ELZ87264.1 sugar kinase [Haloferax elongans ATCC BAA-1513]
MTPQFESDKGRPVTADEMREAPGVTVEPDTTLTLALPKTGLATAEAGDLLLADIGIPRGVYDSLGIDYADPFDGARRVWLRSR